ncbi:hypothetical protein CHS0354_020263 [Potamilus streckersoni]|uniref:PRELI/MSF1 domain-containing protein n=1 Tax=Potamilus streckersoni TaxID=2493646 RepID=A0AAE0S5B8_9BIVA|nr:hypothetical protein CHS0354_020263 [Potamilus streckersoni]
MMVVSINIKHIYRYPVEFVANIHFIKYQCEEEKFVKRIDTLEHRIDPVRGIDYKRRVAVCDNVIPSILRKVHILNEAAILFEEHAWLNVRERCLHLKSRNLTWEKYAQMHETSTFKPCSENAQWTLFEQHGEIDITGLGPFGRMIEVFAEKFLHAGIKRSLTIMEVLLKKKWAMVKENRS